jgi:hypothetical protein
MAADFAVAASIALSTAEVVAPIPTGGSSAAGSASSSVQFSGRRIDVGTNSQSATSSSSGQRVWTSDEEHRPIHSSTAHKSSAEWHQQLRRKCCGLSVGVLYRHSGIALDACAMLKSLFAAISILHLLNPDQISSCEDASVPRYAQPPQFVAPSWIVFQACSPELFLGKARTLFTVGIVVNQITFAVTSILNHTRLGGMMSRQTRSLAAYTLGLLSFVFGFCKILIIVSMSTIANFGFECPAERPSDIFTSIVCGDKSVYVDCNVIGYPHLAPDGCLIPSCFEYCHYAIPPEVVILSATFALTFIYSLFMCDMLLNRPDEVMSLVERQQQLNRDLMDPIKQDLDGEEDGGGEDSLEKDQSSLRRRLAKRERRAAKYGALAVGNSAVAAQISDQLLFEEDAEGEDAGGGEESLRQKTGDEELYDLSIQSSSSALSHRSTRAQRAKAMERAMTRTPRTPASQHDMIELDPLSRKAFELAQSLSAQELLLCMMESDYRKHLTEQLRKRDIFYRLLRDLATLAKFVLTMVSREFTSRCRVHAHSRE